MKVAITVWGNRISPVFDSAQTIMLAEVEDKKVISQKREFIPVTTPSTLARTLVNLEIDTLICGAISENPAHIIEKAGIALLPFIAGNAEKILECFVQNLPVSEFAMPGCRSLCCFQHHGNKTRQTRCCGQEMPSPGRQCNAVARKDSEWTSKAGSEE